MQANDRAGTEHLTSFGSRRFVSKKKNEIENDQCNDKSETKREKIARNSNIETSESITKHPSYPRCHYYDKKKAIEYKDWSSTTIK